jgi:serine/threonine protein kinase
LGLGYDKSVDFWGLGILLYNMSYGCAPFDGESRKELFDNILKQPIKFPFKTNKNLENLINGLLNRNRHERFTYKDIVNHKWLKGINFEKVKLKKIPSPFRIKIENDKTKYFEDISSDTGSTSTMNDYDLDTFKDF